MYWTDKVVILSNIFFAWLDWCTEWMEIPNAIQSCCWKIMASLFENRPKKGMGGGKGLTSASHICSKHRQCSVERNKISSREDFWQKSKEKWKLRMTKTSKYWCNASSCINWGVPASFSRGALQTAKHFSISKLSEPWAFFALFLIFIIIGWDGISTYIPERATTSL